MLKESEIRPDELMRDQADRLAADIRRLLRHKHEFITVNCPACGFNKSHKVYEKYEVQFVACECCGTLYANPRPQPEHLDEYYACSENYAYWNKYIFPASEAIRREKIFKPRVEKVVEICKRLNVQTNTLLEVGAGFGIFCEEMQKIGIFNKIIGVEPTPDLAETCRNRGINIVEKPIEKIEFGNEVIDVIVTFEVIEHLFCPKDFLSKCHSLLAEGGILIITCPNAKGFDITTLGQESSAVDNEHINLFNVSSLTMLLKICGFDLIEKRTPGELDAELVRKQILSGKFDVSGYPFLKQILIEQWEEVGEAFQIFLSQNLLSSNMLLVARKIG
ncbi:class I SAM-dependent methyltransferase [Rhodoferax sp. 4810]|uniref:Class I SAM-dependent methyltransferase n=1 Tax=Thiospirillum jenense TaxID=1653858 RepID=A0A839HB84_9GAMM|nr:class I SAM-dependent methyltransferase [Thiospirillum jenense]MBB1073503.1 class I SAM-dependent methyltransferase [Rhodoferax jenense]MBB1125991.1 class I SAM-dependent methyltransferase [Thiospirillum jenense]